MARRVSNIRSLVAQMRRRWLPSRKLTMLACGVLAAAAVSISKLAMSVQDSYAFAGGYRCLHALPAPRQRRQSSIRSAVGRQAERQLVEKYDVVVVGGGIAGFNAALRLAQFPWTRKARVALVDPKDRFVFQPLLVDYATSDVIEKDDLAPQYDDLLRYAASERPPSPPFTQHAELKFVQGTVTGINREASEVSVRGEDGLLTKINYDSLLLTPGLTPDLSLPGSNASITQRFATLADAEELKAKLSSMNKSEAIAVVGGGYVGVELAASLAEAGRNVSLFSGSSLLRGSKASNRERAAERLETLGVDIRKARVLAVEEDARLVKWASADSSGSARSSEQGSFPCSAVVVTGAGRRPAAGSDVSRLHVDEYLRVQPRVYCLGDAADTSATAAAAAPLSGQAAMAQAEVAAWNAFAEISQLPESVWRKYDGKAMGEFLILGATDAAGTLDAGLMPLALPSALPGVAARLAAPLMSAAAGALPSLELNITGLPASALRRLAYLYRLPTIGHRRDVAARWARRLLQNRTA
eukprot:TRINITY_DN121185_c0_g1_i1.p1 TRINITY_DN121185_c0_g1~~TRINITY_DN121185_c0_g1_i1.p1  ORF type:complete len:527 (+),score=72.44 TRINITY_DN121185_c0_g1_i1:119-1699(+)